MLNKTSETLVTLNTIDKVKAFVNLASTKEFTIDVGSQNGRHCVDGKSIMGLFSLNLEEPVFVSVPRLKCVPDVVPATDEQIAEFFEQVSKL